MDKKFVVSIVLVFVVLVLLSYLVHGVLLMEEYNASAPGVWRSLPDMQQHHLVLYVAQFLAAGAIVWIYRRGRETKPFVGQGLRFGVALAVLLSVSTYLIYFAIQPITWSLASKQIVYDSCAMLLVGILVAWREQ